MCVSKRSVYVAMENASSLNLIKCEVPNETIAKRLKLSTDFIIEQELMQIDAVSDFCNGAFAKVIRASYVGVEVRVKRFHAALCSGEEGVDRHRLDLHRFFQECRLAQTLRHPNIVHYYGIVMDGPHPMLVMEELVCTLYDFIEDPEKYAAAKDIFAVQGYDQPVAIDNSPLVQQVSSPGQSNSAESSREVSKSKPVIHMHKATTIALNVAQGLYYLHTKKPYPLVHRDLTSPNILLGIISNRFVAKIGDFGQSKEIKHEREWSSAYPGTLQYLPPEVKVSDPGQELPIANPIVNRVLTAMPTNRVQQAVDSSIRPQADQIPEALEPDDVITPTAQSLSPPRLKPSIDMYMYGVLIVELASQQAPHKWRGDDCSDSWYKIHRDKTENLNEETILYQVASQCILKDPDERLSADRVVRMIKESFPRPTSAGALNEVSTVQPRLSGSLSRSTG